MKGFIVSPTYRIKDNKAYIYLYGRLENGESFLLINYFRPYFFIKSRDGKKLEKYSGDIIFEKQKTNYKTFKKQKATKIILDNPREVPKLRKEFEDLKVDHYESDIRFVQRFLIDNNIKGTLDIEGEFKKGEYVDRVYENPELKPVSYEPKLKTVSIDIETDIDSGEIFSIAFYTDEYKKVLITSDKKLNKAKIFDDEKSMLKFFIIKMREIDPDIITGWNVVDFDLKVLMDRCKKHNIDFKIGRSDDRCRIRTFNSFFRDSIAKITGRMVLDGIKLLKMSFIKTEDYKLKTAAEQFLGKTKHFDFKGIDKGKKIREMYKDSTQELIDYNLIDAKLVMNIINKMKLINLTIQRSIITGMELDRVNSSIASLDNLYIRETKQRGFICPTRRFSQRTERIKGGYVMDSIPGIYDYIDVLDFKSLYPSIIRTFNIDPLSYVKKGNGNYIVAPNNAKFKKKQGILPDLIQRLWEKRDKAKKDDNKEESYAIKITMNSFFGVLANPMCRFYNLDVANAITSFGRYIVKKTADITEEKGINVIYGDTDSIFVETKADNEKQAEDIGEKIAKEITSYWKEYSQKNFSRDSFLELQFEKTYIKFLMPKIRGSESGAKKRYAGLLNKDGKEEIDFTGLEFVRRDWTDLAKNFQLELLKKVFHNEKITDYIIEFVDKLKDGEFDSQLVYKKAIRKDLDEYVKTTPPHVKAARKLEELTSNIISYVLTLNGPEPAQDIKSSIDYDHYIEKQVKPIANSILVFFNKKFDDVLKGTHQTKLSGF
ncbi:DNA polymerase II [Candidatus Woesearchaeota archaeon]|nr:DNA polymerase II [Candidatus Woesearchaeota archaeon]